MEVDWAFLFDYTLQGGSCNMKSQEQSWLLSDPSLVPYP